MIFLIYPDAGNIWRRLFDHTNFLNGEISFILNEFEVNTSISLMKISDKLPFQLKREDTEVNKLFSIVESITDLRDTGVTKLNRALNDNLDELNQTLTQSLSLSQKVLDLESKYKKVHYCDNYI